MSDTAQVELKVNECKPLPRGPNAQPSSTWTEVDGVESSLGGVFSVDDEVAAAGMGAGAYTRPIYSSTSDVSVTHAAQRII